MAGLWKNPKKFIKLSIALLLVYTIMLVLKSDVTKIYFNIIYKALNLMDVFLINL